jgi:hypothetical protein
MYIHILMNSHLCEDILNIIGEYLPIKDVIKFNFYEAFVKKELHSNYEFKHTIKYKRNQMFEWLFENIQYQSNKLKKLNNLIGQSDIIKDYYSKFEKIDSYFIFSISAEYGNLYVMKFIYSKFEYDNNSATDAMSRAAENNHFHIVKWLQKKFGTFLKSKHEFLDIAAQYGNLKIVKFLSKKEFTCSTNAMNCAAGNGHFKIVKWLHKHRTEGCTTQAIDSAIKNGHFKIYRWLHKYRTEGYSEYMMYYVIRHKNLNNIKKFCKTMKIKLTELSVRYAAETGDIEIFEWIYNKVKKIPEDILYIAVLSNCDLFKHIFMKGIRDGLKSAIECLVSYRRNKILEWILLNC